MALDGIAVAALAGELSQCLIGARVDKIYQPEHDEITIIFRGAGSSYKLLMTANASVARVCLTQENKKNPETAPMFCMLLRKLIGGGKVTKIEQPQLERILKISIESYNEFGDLTEKTLIAELMGRHSNIILVDETGRIADSIKRVDYSVSGVRQVLPGLLYESPPSQGKTNPLACDLHDFLEILKNAPKEIRLDQFLLNSFTGVSPVIAREISYRAVASVDVFIESMDFSALLDTATCLYRFFQQVKDGEFSPCYFVNRATGKLVEFSAVEILQYETLVDTVREASISRLIDDFYRERDRKAHMLHRSASLVKLVSNNIDRCAKKLSLQLKELGDTEKKEKWKEYGELITANLYQIRQGQESVTVDNYYKEGMPREEIRLDPRLTPSQNAQKYFRKYSKAKSAERILTEQIALTREELAYLETVEEELRHAVSESDLKDITDELTQEGYIRRREGRKKRDARSEPLSFETADGFLGFIGRNNRQNDYLTMKTGRGGDLWLHTKNIPGSHVLLRHSHEKAFSDEAILEAAQYAAYHSKARDSQNVPVDYTYVKYVKKPSGAKPGFVTYTNQTTIYVTPKQEAAGAARQL